MLRTRTGIVAAAVALTVLTGCSNNSPDTEQKSLSDHLIPSSEFHGTDVQPIDANDAQGYGQQLSEALETTTYDPAECKTPREEQARVDSDMKREGLTVSDKPNNIAYRFYVTRGGESIDLVKRMFLGACASLTTTRTESGVPATRTVQSMPLDTPAGLGVSDALVYQQTVSTPQILSTDQPLTQTLTQGLAKVGDVMVSVEQTTIDMQRKPDLDGFTDYFEKAISAAKN